MMYGSIECIEALIDAIHVSAPRYVALRRDAMRPFVVTGEIFFSVVPPERATPPLKRVSNITNEQTEMHIGILFPIVQRLSAK